jgi:ABC-type transport system substrate-binding protein
MTLLYQVFFYIQAFILAVLPMNTYTEGVVGQPRSFFPNQIQTHNDKTISGLIFRGLFKYDNFGSLVPDLAESWEISDNETVYTIKLKDKQYWSDGKKIGADDLIYTAFKVSDLAGVATDKVDDLTVRYTLPNKFSPFLSLLTIGVMPADSVERYDALMPITSGPFRVVKVDRSGPIIKQIMLVNPDTNLDIQRLVFRYYENEDQLVTAAKLGDISGFLSSKQVDIENFENHKFPTQSVYYALFINLRNDKFKDVAFRQKLEKLIT